jgi:hypothetical protein
MGMLCLVSIKFEFILLEGGIGSRGTSGRNAAGRFSDQLARRSFAARRYARKNRTAPAHLVQGGGTLRRGARRPPNNRMMTPRGTSVARLFQFDLGPQIGLRH